MLPSPRGKRRQERLSVAELLCSHQQLFITSLSPSLLYSFSPFNLCVCHSLPPSLPLTHFMSPFVAISHSPLFTSFLICFLFFFESWPIFMFLPFPPHVLFIHSSHLTHFLNFFLLLPPPMSLILCPFPLLIYFCL